MYDNKNIVELLLRLPRSLIVAQGKSEKAFTEVVQHVVKAGTWSLDSIEQRKAFQCEGSVTANEFIECS